MLSSKAEQSLAGHLSLQPESTKGTPEWSVVFHTKALSTAPPASEISNSQWFSTCIHTVMPYSSMEGCIAELDVAVLGLVWKTSALGWQCDPQMSGDLCMC